MSEEKQQISTETEESSQELENKDLPTLQQAALTACSLFISELQEANCYHHAAFRSSAEALGVLSKQFMDVQGKLIKSRVVDGGTNDQATIDLSPQLKKDLIQLGAMTIKALYSVCNMADDIAFFSHTLQQNQQVAEMLAAGEADNEAGE